MKKATLICFIFSLTGIFAIAQKKKDLLLKLEVLKSELKSVQADLAESQKDKKVNEVKLSALEQQVSSLKETNASLLNNINTLTEASKKGSQNVGKTLQSLQQKEKQLKVIRDAISQNDSLKLITLTQFKTSLGDSIPTTLKDGVIIVSIPNSELFGDTDKNFEVNDKGKLILERLARTLSENPQIQITVQGNSNALKFENGKFIDNWDLSSRQAASIVRILQNEYQIAPERMNATGKSEYATEGVNTFSRIIIEPRFNQFYKLIKEEMKNEF